MKHNILSRISGISRTRILFSLLSLICCQEASYGQTASNPLETESLFKNQTVNTPAATALMQNIVYPMNYSTGLPEIKIPLYEVTDGDLKLPIYLTYHASGIKLGDASGLVGQGWRLVAEPMVTRKVNGSDDLSYNLTCPFNKDSHWNKQYLYAITQGAFDEQPDEYYYQLANKQGLFMYLLEPKTSGTVYAPLPYDNIHIERGGKSFHITDDEGTLYKFDGPFERSGSTVDLVGWKASSILASNRKDSISFVYNPSATAYSVKVHNDYIVVIDDSSWKQFIQDTRFNFKFMPDGTAVPDEWMQDPIIYNTVNNETRTYQRNENGNLHRDWDDLYYPSVSSPTIATWTYPLREAHFKGGKVVFLYERTRLKEISVYDSAGKMVKKISFDYLDTIGRYFLTSIRFTGPNSTPAETYLFSYNMPETLPRPGDRAIDYWGYYNGVHRSDTTTLVPQQTIEATRFKGRYPFTKYPVELTIGSPLSREANETYMKYGILNGITYPTGSTDQFVYEAHRYETEEGTQRIVGGLRIKQIKSIENGNVKRIRSFTYGRYENGTGYSRGSDNLEYFFLQQTKYYGSPLTWYSSNTGEYVQPDEGIYTSARYRTFFCNPIIPITHENGSAVMYDYVTEYVGVPENNSGKTVYHYEIDKSVTVPQLGSTMQRNPRDGWQYGHLLSKTVYQNQNGNYEPVESLENTYSTIQKDYGKIQTGEVFNDNLIRFCVSGYCPDELRYGGLSYDLTTVDVRTKLLMKTIHKTYTADNTIRTQTDYEYSDPQHTFVTRQTETMDGSDAFITSFTYPGNYGNTAPYTDMVKRNIINPVIKNTYSRGNDYLEIETPYTMPYANVYKPASMVMRNTPSSTADTRFTYLYDERGKARQKTKDEKESVVYLYGYNHQYIIAEIANAKYSDIETKLGGKSAVDNIASAITPSESQWKSINNLRHLLPEAHTITYAYKPLVGVSSITDACGVTTCYNYDNLGRLKKTHIVNGNRNEVIERLDYHYINQ